MIVDPPDPTPDASRSFSWFSAAAMGTWIVCAIWPFSRLMAGDFSAAAAVGYLAAFAIYGAAMLVIVLLPRRKTHVRQAVPVTLAMIETVTMNAITMKGIHGTGLGIGFLVIVAAQLPYLVSPPLVWTWIGAQTVALMTLFLPSNLQESITLGLASGSFDVFAAASSFLAISEGRARHNLARANTELHATRALLAESSRAEERLRISRDLHDTLGHHLTALSLQLDVASRLTDGGASEHVRQAHAITRLLLSDVRDVVSRTREGGHVDVAVALRALAGGTAGVAVRLGVPPTLHLPDPVQADALVKSVQEIITNTVRHARAETLAIEVSRDGDTLVLSARDDGAGTDRPAWGHGLNGMRERFRECGGNVEVQTAPGKGFEIRGTMPVRSAP